MFETTLNPYPSQAKASSNFHAIGPDIISSIHNNPMQHIGDTQNMQNNQSRSQNFEGAMHIPYTAITNQYSNNFNPHVASQHQSISQCQNQNTNHPPSFNPLTNSPNYNPSVTHNFNQSMNNFYPQSSMQNFNLYTNHINANNGHVQNANLNQHRNNPGFIHNFPQNIVNTHSFRPNHVVYPNQFQQMTSAIHCNQDNHQIHETNFIQNHPQYHEPQQLTHNNNSVPNLNSHVHSSTSQWVHNHARNFSQNTPNPSNFHHNHQMTKSPNNISLNKVVADGKTCNTSNSSVSNVTADTPSATSSVSNATSSVSNATPLCERKTNAIEMRKRSTCRRGSSLCKIDEETDNLGDDDKDTSDEGSEQGVIEQNRNKEKTSHEKKRGFSESSNMDMDNCDSSTSDDSAKVGFKSNVDRIKKSNKKYHRELKDRNNEDKYSDAYDSSLESNISLGSNEDLRSDDEAIRTDNDCEELEEDVELGSQDIVKDVKVVDATGPKRDRGAFSAEKSNDNNVNNPDLLHSPKKTLSVNGNKYTERDSAIEDISKSCGQSSFSNARVGNQDKHDDTSGIVSANALDGTDDEVSSNLEDSDLDNTKSIPTSEVGSEEEEALMEELEISTNQNRKGKIFNGPCHMNSQMDNKLELKNSKCQNLVRPTKGAFVKVPQRSKPPHATATQETNSHIGMSHSIVPPSQGINPHQSSLHPAIVTHLEPPHNSGSSVSPSQHSQSMGHSLSPSIGMGYQEPLHLSPSQSQHFSGTHLGLGHPVHVLNRVNSATTAPAMMNQEIECSCPNCHTMRPDILANIQGNNNATSNINFNPNGLQSMATYQNQYSDMQLCANGYPNGTFSHYRQLPNWNFQKQSPNVGHHFNLPGTMPDYYNPHAIDNYSNTPHTMGLPLNQPQAVEHYFRYQEMLHNAIHSSDIENQTNGMAQPNGMGHHLDMIANQHRQILMMGCNPSPLYNGSGLAQHTGYNPKYALHDMKQNSNLRLVDNSSHSQSLQGANKHAQSRNESNLDITSENEYTEESDNESDDIRELVQKRKLEEIYIKLEQKIQLFNNNYLQAVFQKDASKIEEVTSFGVDELLDDMNRLDIQDKRFSEELFLDEKNAETLNGQRNEYDTQRTQQASNSLSQPAGIAFAPNLENLIGFPIFQDIQRPQNSSNEADSFATNCEPTNCSKNIPGTSSQANNIPDSALDNVLSSCEFAHVWNDLDKTKSELNVVLFDVDTACERINELKQLINLKNNLLKFLVNNKLLREEVRAKVEDQTAQLKAKVKSLKKNLYELRHMEEKRNIDKLNMKYKNNCNSADVNNQLLLFNNINGITDVENYENRKIHKRRKHSEQEGSARIVELGDNTQDISRNQVLPWLENYSALCPRPESALSVSTVFSDMLESPAVLPMQVAGDPVSSTETNMAVSITRLKQEIELCESRLQNLSVISKVTLQSDQQIEELSKNLSKWTKRLTTFEKLIESEKAKKEQLKNDLVLNLFKIRSMEETFNRERQKSDVLNDISALIDKLKPLGLLDVIKRDTDVSSSDKTIVTNTPINGSESKSGNNTLKRNPNETQNEVKGDTNKPHIENITSAVVLAKEASPSVSNTNSNGNSGKIFCDDNGNTDQKIDDGDLKKETAPCSGHVKRSSSDKTVVLNTLMSGCEKKLDNLLETESSFDTMGSSSVRNYKITASTEISDNALSVTAVSDKSGGVGSNNETKRKKKSSLSRAFSFRKSHNTVNSTSQCASTDRSAEKSPNEKPEKSTTGKKIKNFILNKSGDKNKSNDSIRFKKPDDQVSNCSGQSNQRVNGREDDKLSNSSVASKLKVIVENRDFTKVSDEKTRTVEMGGENALDGVNGLVTNENKESNTNLHGNRTVHSEKFASPDSSNVTDKRDELRSEIAKLLELKQVIIDKRMKLFPNKCSDQSELNRKLFFEYDETIETIDVLVEYKGNIIRDFDSRKDKIDLGSHIVNTLRNSGESSKSNGRGQSSAKNLAHKNPKSRSSITNNDLYHTLIDKLINLNYNELILVVYKYFNRIIDLRSTSVELEKLVQSLDYKLEMKIAHEQEMNLKFERLHQNNQIANEKHLTQLQKDYQNKLHLFYRFFCSESGEGGHAHSTTATGGDHSFLLREENKFLKSKVKHLEAQLRKENKDDAVTPFKTFAGLTKTITMENKKLVIANRH